MHGLLETNLHIRSRCVLTVGLAWCGDRRVESANYFDLNYCSWMFSTCRSFSSSLLMVDLGSSRYSYCSSISNNFDDGLPFPFESVRTDLYACVLFSSLANRCSRDRASVIVSYSSMYGFMSDRRSAALFCRRCTLWSGLYVVYESTSPFFFCIL